VIAHGADIVLGLPDTPPLDARSRMQRIDDAPPEQVARDCGRGDKHRSRRRGNPGVAWGRLAEDEPEARASGTEQGRRCHRKVELKRVWEQEDAVDGGAAFKIGKPDRVEFADEPGRPVRENVGDRDMAGYGERQVYVGEAIATVHSERAHDGSGYDAVIGLSEPQHAFAESIPLLDGKHAYARAPSFAWPN
jgi:hypothetical protein